MCIDLILYLFFVSGQSRFIHMECLFVYGNDDGIDSNNGETKKRISESKEEAAKLMARVPGLRQKIAGKSIPLELHFLFFISPSFPFLIPFPLSETRRT